MISNNPYIFVNTEVADNQDVRGLCRQPKRVKITNGTPQKLAKSYVPGMWDVICAHGKHSYNHPGNKYFRSLVKRYQGDFGRAQTRLERTIVVTNIVDAVRERGMGFIKKDPKDGYYWQIGDRLSREKVGQMMRDAQGSKYRSSTKSKQDRRQECIATISRNTQRVVLSNAIVSRTVELVSQHVSANPRMSDEQLVAMLTQANCRMLEAMKEDKSLAQRFNHAAKSPVLDHGTDDDETASCPDHQSDESTSPMME